MWVTYPIIQSFNVKWSILLRYAFYSQGAKKEKYSFFPPHYRLVDKIKRDLTVDDATNRITEPLQI